MAGGHESWTARKLQNFAHRSRHVVYLLVRQPRIQGQRNDALIQLQGARARISRQRQSGEIGVERNRDEMDTGPDTFLPQACE